MAPDSEPAKSSETADTGTAVGDVPAFDMFASKYFAAWLAGQGCSLAFATGRTSKVFLVGVGTEDHPIVVSERNLENCEGLIAHDRALYAASKWQIWRFQNALGTGQALNGCDAVYAPKASHVTGDVGCRDLTVDADGRLIFVSSLFNCLGYLSRDHSFRPAWKPSFISDYIAEDRCHLTGLALVDGYPGYVTATATTDEKDGWRDKRQDGGVVIDVRSSEVVCADLSMPRAPRMHGNTLWLQDAGTGYLGRVDTKTGSFERVAFCPGYMRGMQIVGNFAVVCVSAEYDDAGLDLPGNLRDRDMQARCGVVVIDLTSGNMLHWLRLDGVVNELHAVTALPGVLSPRLVGFKSDEIARTISLPTDMT